MGQDRRKKLYNYNIDALRIICTISIVYYHIFSNLEYDANSYYSRLASMCQKANLFVEFFLIIGGYYLWKTINKKSEQPFSIFIMDKLMRLWPVLFCSTIATMFIGKIRWQDGIFDLLFLRNTGISLTNTGIIWYIGPFFWGTVLIAALFKVFSKNRVTLLLTLIVYFSYAINLNYLHGGLGREIIFSFLSLSMLRVIGGISLGVLVGIGLEEFKIVFDKVEKNSFFPFCVSIIELLSLSVILKITLFGGIKHGNNNFLIIIMYMVVLIIFVNNQGLISRMLNVEWISKISKPCYSIYVMQQFSFYVLKRTLWTYTDYVIYHPLRTIVISVAFVVCVGIATYYLVEKKAMSLWDRVRNKIICEL